MRSVFKISSDLVNILQIRGEEPEIPVSSMPRFNRKIWGFKYGELIVLAARPSNGKSAFANQLVLDFIDLHVNTLYLSLEMAEEDILERMFCNKFMVDNMDLLSGKYKMSDAYKAKFKTDRKSVV